MQLVIVAVGHKMPGWIETGFGEYAKRMPPELRIELREVKPEARSSSNNAATVMLNVVVLTPPPVLPGEAPMNISAMVRNSAGAVIWP